MYNKGIFTIGFGQDLKELSRVALKSDDGFTWSMDMGTETSVGILHPQFLPKELQRVVDSPKKVSFVGAHFHLTGTNVVCVATTFSNSVASQGDSIVVLGAILFDVYAGKDGSQLCEIEDLVSDCVVDDPGVGCRGVQDTGVLREPLDCGLTAVIVVLL